MRRNACLFVFLVILSSNLQAVFLTPKVLKISALASSVTLAGGGIGLLSSLLYREKVCPSGSYEIYCKTTEDGVADPYLCSPDQRPGTRTYCSHEKKIAPGKAIELVDREVPDWVYPTMGLSSVVMVASGVVAGISVCLLNKQKVFSANIKPMELGEVKGHPVAVTSRQPSEYSESSSRTSVTEGEVLNPRAYDFELGFLKIAVGVPTAALTTLSATIITLIRYGIFEKDAAMKEVVSYTKEVTGTRSLGISRTQTLRHCCSYIDTSKKNHPSFTCVVNPSFIQDGSCRRFSRPERFNLMISDEAQECPWDLSDSAPECGSSETVTLEATKSKDISRTLTLRECCSYTNVEGESNNGTTCFVGPSFKQLVSEKKASEYVCSSILKSNRFPWLALTTNSPGMYTSLPSGSLVDSQECPPWLSSSAQECSFSVTKSKTMTEELQAISPYDSCCSYAANSGQVWTCKVTPAVLNIFRKSVGASGVCSLRSIIVPSDFSAYVVPGTGYGNFTPSFSEAYAQACPSWLTAYQHDVQDCYLASPSYLPNYESLSRSCSSCSITGTILTCNCNPVYGRARRTSLDISTCDLSKTIPYNCNGFLQCDNCPW